MPYQTPPTFADGNILTSAQLNILSDDIEYLYGLTEFVNVPFSTGAIGTVYYMRRKHRYLHFLLSIDGGAYIEDHLRVYVTGSSGAQLVWAEEDDSDLVGPKVFQQSYDFNTGDLGTALNQFYQISFSVGTIHGTTYVWYFLESPSASL